MLPMPRLLAAALAGLLLCPPAGHAAQLGFHCAITYDDPDNGKDSVHAFTQAWP